MSIEVEEAETVGQGGVESGRADSGRAGLEPNPAENPPVAAPPSRLELASRGERVALLLGAAAVYVGLVHRFTPASLQFFLEECYLGWKTVAAASVLYTFAAASLILLWIVPGFSRPRATFSLLISFVAAGMVLGLADWQEFAGILFGGFLGALAGGLCTLLIDWDDRESSQLVLTVYMGVVGMVLFILLLEYVIQNVPVVGDIVGAFFGLNMVAVGGVAGMAVGWVVTAFMPGRVDRLFKLLLSALFAGVAARVAFLAFLWLYSFGFSFSRSS